MISFLLQLCAVNPGQCYLLLFLQGLFDAFWGGREGLFTSYTCTLLCMFVPQHYFNNKADWVQKKKSKIGADAAKLHANITSNCKHLLFVCWELVKPLYSGSSVCSNSSPSRVSSLHDLSLLTSLPCCFPCFNVWPPCTIVISPFSKCKSARTLSIVGRIREKAVWFYLTWMLQWILMKFK